MASLLPYPAGFGGEPFIVAHRGASHVAPENTLAAFALAWKMGADAIEGDFYLTRDGHVVAIHDKTTKRTAGVDRRVADCTLEELKQLDVGSWKASEYRGERIPTLAEVLATVPAGKKIFIEIKCGPEVVPALRQVLAASSLRPGQTVVISFNAEVILETKRRIPDVAAFWLTDYEQDKATGTWSPTHDDVLASLRRTTADGLGSQANEQMLTVGFVQRLRSAGFQFHVWTVDDAAMAVRFRRLGVDSITTNRPDFIRRALLTAGVDDRPNLPGGRSPAKGGRE
ncbi:MAG: glycerophosphodiester phosphodiesterase [Planctomycetes bacterium]|nr:glycerophosphodiester phosphodiesterase [Planctomycetota bacterium]